MLRQCPQSGFGGEGGQNSLALFSPAAIKRVDHNRPSRRFLARIPSERERRNRDVATIGKRPANLLGFDTACSWRRADCLPRSLSNYRFPRVIEVGDRVADQPRRNWHHLHRYRVNGGAAFVAIPRARPLFAHREFA